METLRKILLNALSEVEKEINNYNIQNIEDMNLSQSAYLKIKKELEQMILVGNNALYIPTYPRFLLDYPETELTKLLLEASYLYKKKSRTENL